MYKDIEGLYTIEKLQKERDITRQSAINIIHKLRAEGRVELKKGSKKRIYKIYKEPIEDENGLYDILDKTPIKLHRHIKHIVYGKPMNVEQAIVDSLDFKEARYQLAAAFLMNKIIDWTYLINKLREKSLLSDFKYIYNKAKMVIRVRKIPRRYEKILRNSRNVKLSFDEKDLLEAKDDKYR